MEIEKIRQMTAYHEASHFVFAILNNSIDENFGHPNCAMINVFEKKVYGPNCVGSTSPNIDENSSINKEIRNQIFCFCFELLCGYTMNKVKLGKGYHFIDSVEHPANGFLDSSSNVKFLSIEDKFETPDQRHDFDKTKNYINLLLKEKYQNSTIDENKVIDIINFIINQIILLVEEKNVKNAIEWVKSSLIKSNGNCINNEELKLLIKKTQNLLEQTDYQKYLNNCHVAFDKDDWSIENNFEGIPFNL